MATVIEFRITAIKLRNNQKERVVTDWKSIQKYPELNKSTNEKLQRRIKHSAGIDQTAYSNFNEKLLLVAQETTIRLKFENKGWLYHSLGKLLPKIVLHNVILVQIRSIDPRTEDVLNLKKELKGAQK